MIETIIRLAWLLLALLPFLLLALLNKKANLKRAVRDRQFPMPVVTLVYCVLLIIFLGWISQWILTLMGLLAGFLTSAGSIASAEEATKLAEAKTFQISGGATAAAVSFDGSQNVNLQVTALNAAKLQIGASDTLVLDGNF